MIERVFARFCILENYQLCYCYECGNSPEYSESEKKLPGHGEVIEDKENWHQSEYQGSQWSKPLMDEAVQVSFEIIGVVIEGLNVP